MDNASTPSSSDSSSRESESSTDASVHHLYNSVNCSRKILQQISFKFLSHYNLKTIDECIKYFEKPESEETWKKHQKWLPGDFNLLTADLHQSKEMQDFLIFHDILETFFITEKSSSSYELLKKLREIRCSISHSSSLSSSDSDYLIVIKFIESIGKDFYHIFSADCIEQMRISAFSFFHPLDQHNSSVFVDLRKEILHYESCSVLNWAKSVINCHAQREKSNVIDCNVPPNLYMEQSKVNNVENIFEIRKDSRVFLLVGESGYGKSHIARGVAHLWLSRTSLTLGVFQQVFFIDFCDVKTTVYDHLVERYPTLLRADDKNAIMENFYLCNILVIIDGFSSAFSLHKKLLEEVSTHPFRNATLLITASSKDISALNKTFTSLQSEIATVFICPFNSDQASGFAQKIIHFFNSISDHDLYKSVETLVLGTEFLQYPLDIILFCLLYIDPQYGHPDLCKFTQSKLVAQVCEISLRNSSANCLEFKEALENAALQSVMGSDSSYSNVTGFVTGECLEVYFPVQKVQALGTGKAIYQFLNKCFLHQFAASALAKSYKGEIEKLMDSKMVCSRRSLYVRLELMLPSLLTCFLKYSNLTVMVVEILDNMTKYVEFDLLLWVSVAHEVGPEIPPELRRCFDKHLQEQTWIMTEKNYKACFSCFNCMSKPPSILTINLHNCSERQVIESIFRGFEKLRDNFRNFSPVEVILLYNSHAEPLRVELPPSIKLTTVEGTISKKDIAVVLQWPDLTSITLRIFQGEIFTTLIDSMIARPEGLQEVTLQLDAGISHDVQQARSLPQLETLTIQVESVSEQNFNGVLDMLLKLMPKRSAGTTIELRSSDLGAQHCKKLIEKFSTCSCYIKVFSKVKLDPQQEKELESLLFEEPEDSSYRVPTVSIEWNRKLF